MDLDKPVMELDECFVVDPNKRFASDPNQPFVMELDKTVMEPDNAFRDES